MRSEVAGPGVTTEMATAWLEGEHRERAGAFGLTVLYDDRCPLCRRLQGWLGGQPTLVPIEFLAAASHEAFRRFPALDHGRTVTNLTVVAANGAVYQGEKAWLVCAWTLPRWRPVAEQLAGRGGRTLVRLFAHSVDGYRHRLIARSYGGGCAQCRFFPLRSAAPGPDAG